jgi:hypothetical protein
MLWVYCEFFLALINSDFSIGLNSFSLRESREILSLFLTLSHIEGN